MTNDETRYTIESPASSLSADRDRAVLALRLGLAVNALRASQRHFLAAIGAPGPGAERDRLWGFLSATAFVKEAMNILSGTKKAPPQKAIVESLARKSDAPGDMVDTINRLLAGTHPMSAVVTRVRNQLAFHWDPTLIGDWVDHYDKATVMWLDATGGTSNGDTLYRAAADSVVYSIEPPTPEELTFPEEKRDAAVRERLSRSFAELPKVTAVLIDYFERAIATCLRDAGATARKASAASSDAAVAAEE
jgi:hypothetical protein